MRCGPHEAILLMCVSRSTRRVDFPRVDGWSTDTPGLGRHSLLVFFRDRGLGVPSIALLLYLFSPKETSEGFLYFSRRSGTPLVISNLPSSHRLWKGRYFFVSGRNWEYDPLNKDDTLGVLVAWTTPENLCECSFCFWL